MSSATELQKRVLTGIAGGLVLVGLLALGGWLGGLIVTLALSMGMVSEFGTIAFRLSDAQEKKYALLCLAWFGLLADLFLPGSEFEILAFFFILLFSYYLWRAQNWKGLEFKTHFQELSLSVFAVVYLVLIPGYFAKMHQGAHGVQWALLFLIIVWAGDTGAYFAGKYYGKTKLYETISPKKTREGALGGLAAGSVLTLLFKLIFFRSLSWGGVFFVPLVVGSVAQVGDLCESFFKRVFEVKDSGSILPGHGGFLDRFDGVVFSLPVMYACSRIFS
jgi:phosphatidate cytidylyltransferase